MPVPQIAGGDEGEFVLRVKGDSMKNAGIFDEDYVVVRPQKTATNGEIVVAMMEGEATVKRFFKEKERVRLQPETTSSSRSMRATWTSWAASWGCAGGWHDGCGTGQAGHCRRIAWLVTAEEGDSRGAASVRRSRRRANGSTECPVCHAPHDFHARERTRGRRLGRKRGVLRLRQPAELGRARVNQAQRAATSAARARRW